MMLTQRQRQKMLRSLKRGPRLTRKQRIEYARLLYQNVTGRDLKS